MPVTASALVPVGSAPAPEEVWALAYLLPVDWSGEVRTTTAWSTDVAAAKSESEHRRGLFGRAVHGTRVTIRSLAASATFALQSLARRQGQSRFLCPLYSDQTPLTAAVLAASDTLNCDTNYRRIFIGQRVAVRDETKFAVKTVIAKAAGTLTLDSPIGADFAADSLVYPLFEAKLLLDSRGKLLTDTVGELVVEAMETPGPWCLDPLVTPGNAPAGFDTYQGYPIFSIPIDWKTDPSFSFRRTGSFSTSGIAQVPTVYGDMARLGRGISMTFFQRSEWWKLAQFFDSRGGRLYPFWMPSPSSDYEFIAYTVNGIKVRANGPEYDWTFRPFIALVGGDGTIQIRNIIGHSRAGTEDTLVLDDVFVEPVVIERLCLATLSRFDSDEMAETWLSDGVCKVELPAIELLSEKEVTIANLNDPSLLPLSGTFQPNRHGGDSGVVVPMFYYPCGAPTERPAGRAADLRLPDLMGVRIQSGYEIDPNFDILVGQVGANLLAALQGSYQLDYDGTADGISDHWNHITVCSPLGSPVFCHESPDVTRHRWRGTKEYLDDGGNPQTITVDFIAEFVTDRDAEAGAWGAVFHVFVYSTEINPNYVDGTVFNGDTTFTVNNPARWHGGLKKCHPRMLLCGSVPTSWYASCGNQSGPGCIDPDTSMNDGFVACDEQENTAPWLPQASAPLATGNIVFGKLVGATDFAAMSLGGGCPTSEIFEHVVVENRLGVGITALRPAKSGWNEATGDIDVANGSGIAIASCLPSQEAEAIDCCFSHPDHVGMNPDCWRGPPSSPAACTGEDIVPPEEQEVCCFPTTSTVTLHVRQKCICTQLIGSCNRKSICGDQTRTFILSVCAATFVDGGNQDIRRMDWGLNVPDPSATYYHINEPFNDPTTVTWIDYVGNNWSFTAGVAEAEREVGGDPNFTCAAYTSEADYDDVEIEVDVLNNVPTGVIVASNGAAPTEGYAFIYDPATNNKLGIYKLKDDGMSVVKTTLAEAELPPEYELPLRLYITRKGSSLVVKPNNNPLHALSVHDCDEPFNTPGKVGLVGNATALVNCRWDNFKLYDNNSQNFVRVSVWYDELGWGVSVPAEAMPLFGQCETEGEITRELVPPLISNIHSSDARSNYLDGGKPYPGNGGPGCNQGVGQCPSSVGDPPQFLVPFADFKSVWLSVSSSCTSGCPEGAVNWCRGFEWYSGPGCTSSS